jgi:hypothetical protein
MGVISPASTPPVVHRKVLTASIWLRTGLGLQDFEVPKRLLLANCERVLEIRPRVVEAVRQLTGNLADEEMARQLDLLVKQPRSAQMLMDKTLGAESVITEDNFAELFQEMLHPHLENERERGRQAVKEEKAKGRGKLRAIEEELKASRVAEISSADILESRTTEDEIAVKALCRDVQKALIRRIQRNKAVGLVGSLILCSPPIFEQAWQSYITYLFAVPLAYLTITGSRLLGTKVFNEGAMQELRSVATTRGLLSKVDRFSIEWDRSRFKVSAAGVDVAKKTNAQSLL